MQINLGCHECAAGAEVDAVGSFSINSITAAALHQLSVPKGHVRTQRALFRLMRRAEAVQCANASCRRAVQRRQMSSDATPRRADLRGMGKSAARRSPPFTLALMCSPPNGFAVKLRAAFWLAAAERHGGCRD